MAKTPTADARKADRSLVSVMGATTAGTRHYFRIDWNDQKSPCYQCLKVNPIYVIRKMGPGWHVRIFCSKRCAGFKKGDPIYYQHDLLKDKERRNDPRILKVREREVRERYDSLPDNWKDRHGKIYFW